MYDFDWYSHHAVISVSLSVDTTKTMEMPSDWVRLVRQCQNWDAESREKFVKKLNSPEVKERLNEFCGTDLASSQEAANIFTDILNCALKSVVKRKSRGQTHKKPTNRRHPYCAELQIAKRVFKKSKRQFNKDHNNIDRRQNYIREKKHFKKFVYLVRKTSTIKKVNDLADLENHDPTQFWASLKKILSPDKDGQECVELCGWFEHFKDLLNCPLPNNTDKQFIRYVADSLELLETIAENNVLLNKPITSGELKEVICHIKTGKSSYLDEIPNEALKFGSDELS